MPVCVEQLAQWCGGGCRYPGNGCTDVVMGYWYCAHPPGHINYTTGPLLATLDHYWAYTGPTLGLTVVPGVEQ